MKVLILAGGNGTRLWPLSHKNCPKQFLKINSSFSFLQLTLMRALALVEPENIFIATHRNFQELIYDQTKEIAPLIVENILLEPCGKNTAPSIAFAVKELLTRDSSLDEALLVMPSDHMISPLETFSLSVQKALPSATLGIVAFGIYPTRPETGYGYIQKKEDICVFIEKPTLQRAQELLLEGNVLWNSGIFLFSLSIFLEEVRNNARQLYDYIENTIAFEELEAISFDYAIMEYSKKIKVFPLQLSWSDVGSWESIYELSSKDKNGNVIKGKVCPYETENSLIYSQNRLITTLGVKNLCIVETEHALLIADRVKAQDIKILVNHLPQDV